MNSRLPSPAELLFGRPIRSNIPVKSNLARADIDNREQMEKTRTDSETNYNDKRCVKDLSKLLPGMKILYQLPNASWEPATVRECCPDERSYVIETPNGSVLRRNRRFLKEISDNAAKKFSFKKVSFDDVLDEVHVPADLSDPVVAAVPVDVPKPETIKPILRRSSRNRRQPERLTYQ